jgi:hypothetical protein
MHDLQPLQTAIVVDHASEANGHLVMRTQSSNHFEVINLTEFTPNNGWRNPNTSVKVRPINAHITIKETP